MNVIVTSEGVSVPDEIFKTINDAVETVLNSYGESDAEVSITLTGNDFIHELNRKWRGIDSPTDVLSFALDESDEPPVDGGDAPRVLGDIVISLERAKEQAEEYGHSLRRETAFLTVHGTLHLLGYDHMEEEDREEMEREQRAMMEKLKISRD